MTKTPEIMYATRIHHGRGEYPTRVVLLKHFKMDDTVKEYSTHIQVVQSPNGPYFYGGHYYTKLRIAIEAFNKRTDGYLEFKGQHIGPKTKV